MNKRRVRPPVEDEETKMLRFMADPGQWPCWPWLPMKRWVAGVQEVGVLHADDYPDKLCHVFLGNLFEIKTYFPTPAMLDKVKAYENHSQMVQDGWKVD